MRSAKSLLDNLSLIFLETYHSSTGQKGPDSDPAFSLTKRSFLKSSSNSISAKELPGRTPTVYLIHRATGSA
jgi:hypothetical protein